MASYTTIIDQLLRLEGEKSGARAAARVRAGLRLYPAGEALTDPDTVDLQISEQTRAWATALAFEQLRGWRWPFWLNLQTNPAGASAAICGEQVFPLLYNHGAREAMPLVLDGKNWFAGTMDRRGMVVPRDGRFAVEVWCRIGDELICPAAVLDESAAAYGPDTAVKISGKQGTLEISVVADAIEEFQFLRLTSRALPASPSPVSVAIYISVRPYGLAGVVPVHDLVYNSKGFWMSDNRVVAVFRRRPDISWASDARLGDAAQLLEAPPERTAVRCAAGMATAVSAFQFEANATDSAGVDEAAGQITEVLLPLEPLYPREVPFAEILPGSGGSRKSTVRPRGENRTPGHGNRNAETSDVTKSGPGMVSPGSAVSANREPIAFPGELLVKQSLVQLLAVTDITAPSIVDTLVYRNHWIVAVVRALMEYGERPAAARLVSFCLLGIQRNGYLPQGRGKWAFQGQMLTALADFYRLADAPADETLTRYTQVRAMAKWIMRKRREVSHAPNKPAGLLPPGVSRNGIGQDYYLADNFWGIEGLQAASWLARQFGEHSDADAFHADAMKFAANVKAAIHRELEYGIMQQVPGRLHRAFDASSAAELLDLVLMDEARAMLAPVDWFDTLQETLAGPLDDAVKRAGEVPLLLMDERGVLPARRLLLLLAHGDSGFPGLLDHLAATLTTPLLVWPDAVDPATRRGCGQLMFDPEAAALYLLLARKLNPAANNQAT